ncbi:class I SAM-dependent methyltransferase [Novosphingobium cyanobacteriorum]|uniref:Class I SAM-dependent methyltransferase n=1 Tax=Novosphingobium cyanobacteriorum TaxID=3024215 RepID=A0ABT6CDX4_9SPHN|nr:class I SAM-dependent methyltransferase [Novosphingobium cyanobacteriorum]MDF8332124.1 class I SAM-dependent methyltransferase [Novosphingobium cyanobacteriorum]
MDAAGDWAERLDHMEQWYRDLLASGTAEAFLHNDYAPHRAFLSGLHGRVIDVGGGAGVAGRYLPPSCTHVVVDPAAVWQDPAWKQFSASFAAGRSAEFVQGTGEALPFATAEFDAGLAFWSLNHAGDPARCVAELARVVRPAGKVLLVLEDMEPTWGDCILAALRRTGYRLGLPRKDHGGLGALPPVIREKLSRNPWPLQDDHCRIDERDLMRWAAPAFRLTRREWLGGFLAFEFVRR